MSPVVSVDVGEFIHDFGKSLQIHSACIVPAFLQVPFVENAHVLLADVLSVGRAR